MKISSHYISAHLWDNNTCSLKEYIGANPAFKYETSATVVQSKFQDVPNGEYVDEEMEEQFYDATDSSSGEEDEEESDDDDENQDNKVTIWF
ncbi:hypothetical protein AtEden1_Chr5g0117751 [Arabidopsis thaliana]